MIFGIDFGQLASLISQWYFGPDAKLAANFVVRESLRLSYSLALTINLVGALSLYFPIRFGPQLYHLTLHVAPLNWALGLFYLVESLKVWARLLRLKATKVTRKIKSRFGLKSGFSQNNHEAISEFIRESRFTYGTLFVFNLVPIPIVGMILTGGSFVFIRSYGIRHGLLWVIAAKFTKVTAIAAICYLYRPVAAGLIFALGFIQPVNHYWAPVWAYALGAYAPLVISYFVLFFKLFSTRY